MMRALRCSCAKPLMRRAPTPQATGVAVPASEPAKPTPAVSSGTFSDFLRSAPPPQVLAAASAAAADADGCDVCGDTHCYWEPLPLASELLCLAKELPRLCEKAHAHAGQALRPRLRSALQQLRQANTAAMWLAAVGAATATLVSLVFESARLRSEVRALDVECRLLHLKCNMLLFR